MNSIPNNKLTWDYLLETEILYLVRSSICCLIESNSLSNKKSHIFMKYLDGYYHIDIYDLDQNLLFKDMVGSILELQEIIDVLIISY